MKTFVRYAILNTLAGSIFVMFVWSQLGLPQIPFVAAQQEATVKAIPSEKTAEKVLGQRSDTKQDEDLEKDVKRIEQALAVRNVNFLIGLSDELHGKWRDNPLTEAYLQKKIVDALSSYDFQDKKQYLAVVKISKQTLKNAEKIPITAEYEFVAKLQSSSVSVLGVITQNEWEKDRSERIKLISQFWNRFRKNFDATFDFKDPRNRPAGNVPVPAPKYMPGTDPDAIPDPEIRSQYLVAIATNKAKAEKYNLQLQLHQLSKQLPDFFERAMIELYSQMPNAREELKQNLLLFDVESTRKEKIMAIVDKNLQS